MIQHISRKNIDVQKYDACIENSIQSRVFAYSWYLGIVAENWDVLVLGDYEAVMPLPWKRKYLIHFITQPYFTQQLGVFSQAKLTADQIEKFINSIPKKFVRISIQLNSENKFKSNYLTVKNNYILKLNADYISLFKSFSKGRKHAIQQAKRNKLCVEEVAIEDLIKLAKENYTFKGINEKEYDKLEQLIGVLLLKGKVKVLGVKVEGKLIGGSVFVFELDRIVYLFSAVSSEAKKTQAASFLLNTIIEKNTNSNKVLDFEGSMSPSIASFFKSFGSVNEPYFFFKKSLL